MRTSRSLGVLLMSAALLPIAGARAAGSAGEAPKPPPVVQSFVVSGPSTPADLAKLRETVLKASGVVSVDVRAGVGGATLTVKGDTLYTVIAAAAQPLGYAVQPSPTRFFDASGPASDADLSGLRTALGSVPGADRIAMSRIPGGAAVRVTGIAANGELRAAARSAGFALRQLGSYVASGPTTDKALGHLRAALSKAAGVEKLEVQPLSGGATLLVHGDVRGDVLTRVAKSAGYNLWPLNEAARPRAEFRVDGTGSSMDLRKLREVLQRLEGLAEIEITNGPEGPRVSIGGERLKPERVAAAAAEAGFRLTLEERVSLPTLVPQAGRNTPPDYDNAIVEDPILPGGPAPQFTLLSEDGKSVISLSDYVGKRPVVLLFGSCS